MLKVLPTGQKWPEFRQVLFVVGQVEVSGTKVNAALWYGHDGQAVGLALRMEKWPGTR